MILENRHIEYLELVHRATVRLWWSPWKKHSKIVCYEKGGGIVEIDQTVAAQMKALGATCIRKIAGTDTVILTGLGASILADEKEAWGPREAENMA